MQLLDEGPPLAQDGTGPGAFDAAWLQRFVARLSAFEAQMNQVVVDSGILRDVPPGALRDAGTLLGPPADVLPALLPPCK